MGAAQGAGKAMIAELLHFLRSGGDARARGDADYRRGSIRFTLTLAVPVALLFSPVNYLAGHQWLGLLLLGVGAVLSPWCFLKPKDHHIPLLEITLMICATLVFMGLWLDGGIGGTGIYWVFIYPFVAFYITGLRFGWLWMGLFAFLLAAAWGAAVAGWFSLPWTADEATYFGAALLFYSLMACLFEYLREAAQSRLLSANQQLRQEVEQRVRAEEARARAEAQLLHAEKLRSLGVLAGGIAHDFNNLLSIIMGNAELTRMEARENSSLARNMREIEGACERAAELCGQLLAYAGKGQIHRADVAINDVVREVADGVRDRLGEGVRVKLHLGANLPPVRGDVAQLHQVLGGLLVNAAEAIACARQKSQGKAEDAITISTGLMYADDAYLRECAGDESPPPAGDYLFVEVSDTGCGLKAEDQSRIFDPFYSTKDHGRGMGLSAALGVVRGHHGAIHVESEPAGGSRFRVLLPPVREAREAAKPQAHEGWRGEGTVLVVDDDDLVRKLCCRMLQKMGFSTLAAAGGKEAVSRFRDVAGDIESVVLDYSMPDMNGEEVFLELHRIRPETPVILCSGFARRDVLDRFRAEGLAGFLSKPFSRAQLQAELRKVLEQRRAG